MVTNKNLSELLAEARGLPIRLGDFEARAIYEIPIRKTSTSHVSFVTRHLLDHKLFESDLKK
jgi:hypothetical protein